MIELHGQAYQLIENYKDGFQPDEIQKRFVDLLKKYDYIVGDWGYDQLRLKGFYHDDNMKASYDTKISSLDDYLFEYCNFGCPYFVLQKVHGS